MTITKYLNEIENSPDQAHGPTDFRSRGLLLQGHPDEHSVRQTSSAGECRRHHHRCVFSILPALRAAMLHPVRALRIMSQHELISECFESWNGTCHDRMLDPLLTATDLHKTYRRHAEQVRGAARPRSGGACTASSCASSAASGSGKSTLLHLLGTLDRPDQGDDPARRPAYRHVPAAERDQPAQSAPSASSSSSITCCRN